MTFAFNLLFFPLVFLEEEVEGVTRLFRENLFQVLVIFPFPFFSLNVCGTLLLVERETERERRR